MRAVGDKQTGIIRPDFDRSISIDFRFIRLTSTFVCEDGRAAI